MKNMELKISIDKMKVKDINGVHEISKESFSKPWSYDAIFNELYNDMAYYLVARNESEEVVGFCGSWLVFDECQITNIAVKEEYKKNKIASKLVFKLIEDMKTKNMSNIFLEVRVSNTPAKNFYEKMGFEYCGLRKKFYEDKEDANLMRYDII